MPTHARLQALKELLRARLLGTELVEAPDSPALHLDDHWPRDAARHVPREAQGRMLLGGEAHLEGAEARRLRHVVRKGWIGWSSSETRGSFPINRLKSSAFRGVS